VFRHHSFDRHKFIGCVKSEFFFFPSWSPPFSFLSLVTSLSLSPTSYETLGVVSQSSLFPLFHFHPTPYHPPARFAKRLTAEDGAFLFVNPLFLLCPLYVSCPRWSCSFPLNPHCNFFEQDYTTFLFCCLIECGFLFLHQGMAGEPRSSKEGRLPPGNFSFPLLGPPDTHALSLPPPFVNQRQLG